MSLEDQVQIERADIHWHEGAGLIVSMTEPTGGEISIAIGLPEKVCRPDGEETVFYGVKCDSARAREVAMSILELADIVRKSEDDRA